MLKMWNNFWMVCCWFEHLVAIIGQNASAIVGARVLFDGHEKGKRVYIYTLPENWIYFFLQY